MRKLSTALALASRLAVPGRGARGRPGQGLAGAHQGRHRQGRRQLHPRQRAPRRRDWPSYGLDYAETRFSQARPGQRRQREGPGPGLVLQPRIDARRRGHAAGRRRHHVRHARPGASCTPSTCAPARSCGATTRRSTSRRASRAAATWSTAASRSTQGKVYRRRLRRPADRARRGHRPGGLGEGHDRRPQVSYTITGAPRVFKGKVIIGNGGAEYGVRGYVTAYDADTGEQKWRWFTVPGDPAKPLRERGDGQGRQDLGPGRQVLGGRRRRHRVGHDDLRSRAEPHVHRHRQRLALGAAASAARRAATTSTCRRSSRSTRTPASTSGTTRRRPATTGTTPRRSR